MKKGEKNTKRTNKPLIFIITLLTVILLGVTSTLIYITNTTSKYCIVVNNGSEQYIKYDGLQDYINNIKVYTGNIDITSCTSIGYDESTVKRGLNEIYNIPSFMGGLKQSIKLINMHKTYDKGAIKAKLEEYNTKQPESKDAYISKSNGKYIIVDEQYGKQLNIDKLLTNIDNIEDIDISNYYMQPSIKSAVYADLVNEANGKLSWYIEYDNGEKYSAGIENIEIDVNENKININTGFIDEMVHKLEKTYDNIGKGVTVITSNGEEKTVTGGTWGTLMNSAEEKEYIISSFEKGINGIETNRRPILKQDYTEIGNTYIEVSIGQQHLWYYKDGILQSETNVVTGDAGKKHNTPTGVYFISERINGKYLRGTGYTTWVNKWMRLTGTGIGLHDAGWRGSFGGNIYKSNGSHGCINLPKNYAYELYENTYVGMPVIVY